MKWLQVLLFNTLHSFMHGQMVQSCYLILIFQFRHTVKEFLVLLCITNNSIKHQSFVYTQSNGQIVLFLTIQFYNSFVYTQLNVKQFYLNQFYSSLSSFLHTIKWFHAFLYKSHNISHLFALIFCSIWCIATTPGQSRPGSNGNEGVCYIPQSIRTVASPSDCLVSYLGLSVGWGSYLSAVDWKNQCFKTSFVSTQLLHHEQDVTQGQFLSRLQLVWIQSFLSPRLVTQFALQFIHHWRVKR